MCIIHKMVQGFGGMGDGYVCVKCGYNTYHRPLNAIIMRLMVYDLMHFYTYPYIRKFKDIITWETDTNNWTHYYSKEGNLVEREHV